MVFNELQFGGAETGQKCPVPPATVSHSAGETAQPASEPQQNIRTARPAVLHEIPRISGKSYSPFVLHSNVNISYLKEQF